MRYDQEQSVDDRHRLLPESLYVVQLSESAVSCTHPDGTIESVTWDDLQQIEIVTTDQGPFLPDVLWVLQGSEVRLMVPQGATGESELLERLQQLAGFWNEAVIEAMSSAENRRFLCWKRIAGAERVAGAGRPRDGRLFESQCPSAREPVAEQGRSALALVAGGNHVHSTG